MGIPKAHLRAILVGAGVSFATACLMLSTESHLGITWDEGYTLGREERLRDWFNAAPRSRSIRRGMEAPNL